MFQKITNGITKTSLCTPVSYQNNMNRPLPLSWTSFAKPHVGIKKMSLTSMMILSASTEKLLTRFYPEKKILITGPRIKINKVIALNLSARGLILSVLSQNEN